ncbi:MAG: sigma 54-interacting transcriptional regulator [Pseudomonadota bacterium]
MPSSTVPPTVNARADDLTLTSPMLLPASGEQLLLCLTIVWHPDLSRIGDQAIMVQTTIDLSRLQPVFSSPEKNGTGLDYAGISREAIRIARDKEGVLLAVPTSRMVVESNGQEIQGQQYLSHEQITAGVILGLGRAVLICLHWLSVLPKRNAVVGLIGVGSAAMRTRDLIHQVAKTETAVLLLGETGTGKEVAARAIHSLSKRADRPLVSVNMAALNESLAAADLFGAGKGAYTGATEKRSGFFQDAQDATLFLDEVGNAPVAIQPMLLRVLETGDYRPLGASRDLQSNARIIAATDQDLYDGGFNPALLRRLESFVIHLPPLRHRREDIGLLIVHIMRSAAFADFAQCNLPYRLVSEFATYDWPGNIRQLRHLLKRVLLGIAAGEIPAFASLVDDAPPQRITQSAESNNKTSERAPRKKLSALSEDDVVTAMENNDWYIQQAAQELGISRPSMYKLLESNSHIRHIEEIPKKEIQEAWQVSKKNIETCASVLKTPADALKRHLRELGVEA